MTTYTVQLSDYTDHLGDDMQEHAKRPYPFHVQPDGSIGRQDFWRGDPLRVAGFVTDVHRQHVDLSWEDAVAGDIQQVVGSYVITADSTGWLSTHLTAVQSVTAVD